LALCNKTDIGDGQECQASVCIKLVLQQDSLLMIMLKRCTSTFHSEHKNASRDPPLTLLLIFYDAEYLGISLSQALQSLWEYRLHLLAHLFETAAL